MTANVYRAIFDSAIADISISTVTGVGITPSTNPRLSYQSFLQGTGTNFGTASGTVTVSTTDDNTQQTSDRPVTVGIADSENNADLTVSPSGTSALVFDATTWQTAQTVTVEAEAADDTATLTFPVEVGDTGDIILREGTTTYRIGERTLTVTVVSDALAGSRWPRPATLDRDVTIRLAPPGADVPLDRGRYGFGPAGARAVVDLTVASVPAGGLDVYLPVPAGLRMEAGERTLVLVRYTGQQWEPVAGAEDDAVAGQVCATGVTVFSPFVVGYANLVPTFEERAVADRTYTVGTAVPLLTLPAATGGDGRLTYTLTGPAGANPPAGLSYTPPTVEEPHGGTLSGTPTEAQPPTPYTLTATDVDGDVRTLTFRVEIVRVKARVTIADATAEEGAPVQFQVTVARALAAPLTLHWTAGRPGSATPGEDYQTVTAGQMTVAAGATAGTLMVRTLDDRRVEPTETFTVTVTLPAETSIELVQDTVEGRIEDDDTEQARKRSLGMVLAGVGRTLATDAVDVIGDRFERQPTVAQATVGGQAVDLERTPQGWRHAAGVVYGVARALGVEVGSPLVSGDGQFGQVRGAAWSTLTRHLRDPHAPTLPLSALDASAPLSNASWSRSIPPPSGRGLGGGRSPAWGGPADAMPFGRPDLPGVAGCGDGLGRLGCGPEVRIPRGLAGYGPGLGQLGFDRAHAATPTVIGGSV